MYRKKKDTTKIAKVDIKDIKFYSNTDHEELKLKCRNIVTFLSKNMPVKITIKAYRKNENVELVKAYIKQYLSAIKHVDKVVTELPRLIVLVVNAVKT